MNITHVHYGLDAGFILKVIAGNVAHPLGQIHHGGKGRVAHVLYALHHGVGLVGDALRQTKAQVFADARHHAAGGMDAKEVAESIHDAAAEVADAVPHRTRRTGNALP